MATREVECTGLSLGDKAAEAERRGRRSVGPVTLARTERVKDTTVEDDYVGFGLLGKGRAVVQDLLVEELP